MIAFPKSLSASRVLLILVGLCLLGVGPGHAKKDETLKIGKVDFRAIVLLHPLMVAFDVRKGSFKLTPAEAKKSKATVALSQEHKEKIAELERNLRSVRTKLADYHQSYVKNMKALSDNHLSKIETLATGPAAMKRQLYEVERDQQEMMYQSRIHSFSGQVVAIESELSKLKKTSILPGYTIPEETKKRFVSIVQEARRCIETIAAQKGIQIVLNTNFSRVFRLPKVTERGRVPKFIDASQIFTTPFADEPDNDHGKEEDPSSRYDFVTGYYAQLNKRTKDWLNAGDTVLEPFQLLLGDTDILVGGVDLTVEVLTKVLANHNINPNVSSAVIRAVMEQ